MVASEPTWQPQRPQRLLRSKMILKMNSGPKIHVNRHQFGTVYQIIYSSLRSNMAASEAIEATEVKKNFKNELRI